MDSHYIEGRYSEILCGYNDKSIFLFGCRAAISAELQWLWACQPADVMYCSRVSIAAGALKLRCCISIDTERPYWRSIIHSKFQGYMYCGMCWWFTSALIVWLLMISDKNVIIKYKNTISNDVIIIIIVLYCLLIVFSAMNVICGYALRVKKSKKYKNVFI